MQSRGMGKKGAGGLGAVADTKRIGRLQHSS